MEIDSHIEAIRREGVRLAAAASRAGLDDPIPWCPGWDTRDLLRHLSEIHLWAASHVARRAVREGVSELADLEAAWPDLANFWPDDESLIDYYLATNSNLVAELESAPADLATWTFLPAPSPLAMWARRQAHETAVHRFDAENAAAIPSRFAPAFAADGDNMKRFFDRQRSHGDTCAVLFHEPLFHQNAMFFLSLPVVRELLQFSSVEGDRASSLAFQHAIQDIGQSLHPSLRVSCIKRWSV